jgi:hypothetical protein
MIAALLNSDFIYRRFEPVASFSIVVPDDYNHATRLGDFLAKHGRKLDYYDPAITDANYAAKATIKLVPGRKMECEVVWTTDCVSSDDCLAFLKNHKARLLGAQGASLAYEQGKKHLPKGRDYASFGKKDALWKDSGGSYMVPRVSADEIGGFRFELVRFEDFWIKGHGLLCFYDD